MSKFAKILVTALIVFLFIFIFAIIAGVSSDSGSGPGIVGLAVFAGAIAAIRAVWKNDDKDNNSDSSILQK